MARIGVLNDYSEVVVAIAHLITPGHRLVLLAHADALDTMRPDEALDVVVAVLFRAHEALGRPIEDFRRDVVGGDLLYALQRHPATAHLPVIVFGIGVKCEELPPDLRFHTYLAFPEAIQELNPLLSGLFGPVTRVELGA